MPPFLSSQFVNQTFHKNTISNIDTAPKHNNILIAVLISMSPSLSYQSVKKANKNTGSDVATTPKMADTIFNTIIISLISFLL